MIQEESCGKAVEVRGQGAIRNKNILTMCFDKHIERKESSFLEDKRVSTVTLLTDKFEQYLHTRLI